MTPSAVLAVFGLDAEVDGPGADSPASVGRVVAAAAERDGEAFWRRLVGAYVVNEPRFRFGLVPRAVTTVVRPRDWERLVLDRFDELPRWNERDFMRWLNGLIAARTGAHRPGGESSGPTSGDDATPAALIASINANG